MVDRQGVQLTIREIRQEDVPALLCVRVATRENALSLEQLERLGITEATVPDMLEKGTHRGWLCEADGDVAAFAMGDRTSGEMWVIAVLPAYEGCGIGRELLTRVENWLWAEGWGESWLTTDVDPSLRAYGFYLNHGWVDDKIEGGMRYMKKANPDLAEGRKGRTSC